MPKLANLALLPLAAALVGGHVGLARADSAPVAVELFTSQGCYSCPPAEAYLRRLADRPDVVALEFHVDYWDELVYGRAGKWKDAYSSQAHTDRQRAYNLRIRRRAAVYTPQMVVGGRFETVGSREDHVERAIQQVRDAPRSRAEIGFRRTGDGRLEVSVSGASDPASVWLVTFLRAATTEVRAGENKGKTLVSRNIVTGLREIGRWDGNNARIAVGDAPRAQGEGCAVLVQDGSDGPILGAAYCPAGG